jgi:hypothetical protein
MEIRTQTKKLPLLAIWCCRLGLFSNNLNNNKMKLEIGMKFTSKWFECKTEILAINKEENTLDVEIHRASGHNHIEEWNLQHTLWGFERGEYRLLA